MLPWVLEVNTQEGYSKEAEHLLFSFYNDLHRGYMLHFQEQLSTIPFCVLILAGSCCYLCVYIHTLDWTIYYRTKQTKFTRHKRPSFELLLKIVQETPKHYRQLLSPLVVLSQRLSLNCWRHYTLWTQDPEDQSWVWLKSLIPGDCPHGSRRCHVSFQRRESSWFSYIPRVLRNHSNDQPGMLVLTVQ